MRDWVAGSSCDAWLFRKGSYDPLAYAVMWNQRLALANQLPRYMESVDRWLRYFERLNIKAMGYGAEVDAPLAALLAHVDGVRSISEIIDRTAQVLSADRSDDVFLRQVLEVIRSLIAHGFLVVQP